MPRGGMRPGSGRKPKPEAVRLKAHPLSVYLTAEERTALTAAAEDAGQSVASYAREILTRSLRRRSRKRKSG